MELIKGGTLHKMMEDKKLKNEWFTERQAAEIMKYIL